MDRERVSRFPGARGRIPNFAGADAAAERLAGHPAWGQAATIKANPDSPQTHARRLALAEGKQLVMAVPRLRDERPFRLLDPRRLDVETRREAATIKGAMRHGQPLGLEQVPALELVLVGSVAVNRRGARIGKGGGFADLEYGMLAEAGKVERRAVIATTVHAVQLLEEDLPMTAHDLPLDLIVTAAEAIDVEPGYDRPRGILPDHLEPSEAGQVPVLARLGYA